MNEADTCRTYVTPNLVAAGWDQEPHAIGEQRTFTDGRIAVRGHLARRGEGKRADYILRYTPDFPIAVVEAKDDQHKAGDGLGQAKEYAEILGLKFAYSTNGPGIVEFDYCTGLERVVERFPGPDELWQRLRAGQQWSEAMAAKLLTPAYHLGGKSPRYYQEIAIQRVLEAVLRGQRRVLLTMATGTGKTFMAFQICWKLWNAKWNRAGEGRRPRMLFLADRNVLVDDPKDKDFVPFGDARWKIESGDARKSREMYFATYQAIARDEARPGLYREYAPDFFDLILVDECHRGSANEESNWREILTYFEPAYQLGMTATPLREENRDTYLYFGNPVYQYSLRQGIDDGFLAPYRVHQIMTSFDAGGWRPGAGTVDRYGREIPDQEYGTEDFERVVALRARTEAIARHLTDFLVQTDRMAKTVVFCVDQEHALEMRRALTALNAGLAQQYPDYICRVTAAEGDIGRGHLEDFQDVDRQTPVILTTSKLLTTGVDMPTCQNVVLARVVRSLTEFKQIVGRGTRVREDYGKLYFNILDYTGSTVEQFRDPKFDGYPAYATRQEIDEHGRVRAEHEQETGGEGDGETGREGDAETRGQGDAVIPAREPDEDPPPRKYYYDQGHAEIVAHWVREFDRNGYQLRTVKFTDYTGEQVRTLVPSAEDFRRLWLDPDRRAEALTLLAARGIDLDTLLAESGQLEADIFDLLCATAYGLPVRTRRERADRVRKERRAFLERYQPLARAVLEDLLEKYAAHGLAQWALPEALKVPPISNRGTVLELIRAFGGEEPLRQAIEELEMMLYAA